MEAVYHDQLERLRGGARELLASEPPARALRLWMDLFVSWAATKRGMTDTLRAMVASGEIAFAQTRSELRAIMSAFVEAGGAAGEIRGDVEPDDIFATLTGILTVAGAPEQRAQAGRMLDLLMDGLRPVAAGG